MASQLDTLRKTYDSLDTTQKGHFVTKLKEQLKGNKNAAYSEFLMECVQDYNREVRINTTITKTGRADIQVNNFYRDSVSDIEDEITGKKMNTMALVGFIVGLSSLLLNFMGIVGIVACVFSGIGLGKFDAKRENNKWMAITGLVLGIVGVVWGFFSLFLLF